jgi:rhodanese-related sulfurtransferase
MDKLDTTPAESIAFKMCTKNNPQRADISAYIHLGFMRAAGICMAAAILSTAIGLTIRHRIPPLPPELPKVAAPAAHGPLSLAEFRTLLDSGKCLVLDAREDSSYDRSHIPGALSLPAGRFTACYPQLKPKIDSLVDQPIVVYCSSSQCDSSNEVRKQLEELGYSNVLIFPGGWTEWKEAGYPQEMSERAHRVLAPWKRPS